MFMTRLAVFLLALHCGVLIAAVEDDIRRIRTLSDSGHFAAAESFFSDKFQQPDLAEIDKISLATEVVRMYSQSLFLFESAQRPRIIRRIETLESTLLTPLPYSPLPSPTPSDLVLAKITFRLQCAIAYCSLGGYQRLEADTASLTNRPSAYRQARSTLQDSIERLKIVQQELQSFRQRVGSNADALLQQKMLVLEYSITMQLGITQKSLALTLQVPEERNVELRQAIKTLSEVAAIPNTEPIIVQCKIEEAACHRLLGEFDRCTEILFPLLNHAALMPECRLRTEAEWIRYNIADGKVAELRRHYAADRPDVKLHPDFDLARLELFLANDPSKNIRPEISTAMRLEETIGRQLGPYWAKRAGMLMQSSDNSELNSAERLAMRAERRYQEQQFIESAELYEQAAAKSDANRQAENMYRYHRSAVHVWEKVLEQLPSDVPKEEYQKRLIVLLKKLVEQNPNHPDALNLHLSAINLQARLVLSQSETLDDYLALVTEHAEHWNDSPHLPLIRRVSVIFLEQQRRFDEAAALLPLLDFAQLETLTPEIQRLRVRQLDSEGKIQEAIDILAGLLKQKQEPATLQLLAEILTRQPDTKSLEYALKFWTDLESITARNSEMWWAAREGIFDVLYKLNRLDEARDSYKTLRILYPELGGTERKARLNKRFEEN